MVEYFKGDADTHLATFRMYNLQFYVEKKTIRASNMPLSDLQSSDFSSLTFNDHNKAVPGKSIRHGCFVHDHSHTCAFL